MRLSEALVKTLKTPPREADSVNARLLTRGGFISQLSAGVYSYLPLGLRVLNKIADTARNEMNAIGAEEVLMPALHPRSVYDTTERWDLIDVMYRVTDTSKKEFALGSTHEEISAVLAKNWLPSYKDLPKAFYQIQTKFRDEPRPKSGLLRGREFVMKDLYSFHTDTKDLERYYEEVVSAYFQTYETLGLEAKFTSSSGGVFSKYSDEFQVFCDTGEDTVYYCEECDFIQNEEIAEVKEGDKCPNCKKGTIKKTRAIEVGNIFKLGTRFSEPLGLNFADPSGHKHPVVMASYGLGISRAMGAIVEVHHDDKGVIWPKSVAPAAVHLVALGSDAKVTQTADKLYRLLSDEGKEVIYDDREESAGVKFADADLIGVPLRVTISDKTLKKDAVELKARDAKDSKLVKFSQIQSALD